MGLLDDISKLTTPVAELPDVEDDNFDAPVALKSTKKGPGASLDFFEQAKKYAGKKVSRSELFGDVSEIAGLEADVDDDEEEEEEDVDDEEDEDLEDEEEDDEDVSQMSEDDVAKDEENEENAAITAENDKTADKATAVRNQRRVWDDLMYANIRMHALLNLTNQMPRGEARKNLLKTCDEKTMTSLQNALANMAKLRSVVQQSSSSFGKKEKETQEDDDDEEIPSDDDIIPSDDEEIDSDEENASDAEEPLKKPVPESSGTSLKTLEKNLQKLDTSLDKFRSTTITKWYNRTRLLSSKSMNNTDFSVFEKGSILGQIQKVLGDEEKLVKKVRTNRSGVPRIGHVHAGDSVVDNEIFDDSDFYQTLLKKMLESRSSQNSQQDGADMTRSYMELQMLSQKKKRDVSQLSSKDRRLKYEPVAKLINFYPSKPSVVKWSHESRNELFKSLFT